MGEAVEKQAHETLKALLGKKGPTPSILCRHGRQEIIDALLPILSPAEGGEWRMVPVEMTREMRFAWECMDGNPVEAQWAAVLAAAPRPQPTGGVEREEVSHELVGIAQHLEIERGPAWQDRKASLLRAAGDITAARWALRHAREVLSRLHFSGSAADFDASRNSGVAICDNALARLSSKPGEGR